MEVDAARAGTALRSRRRPLPLWVIVLVIVLFQIALSAVVVLVNPHTIDSVGATRMLAAHDMAVQHSLRPDEESITGLGGMPPLYLYVLGPFFRVASFGLPVAQAVGVGISTITLVAFALLVGKLFDRTTGLLSALILGSIPAFVSSTFLAGSLPLALLFAVLALWLLTFWVRSGNNGWLFLAICAFVPSAASHIEGLWLLFALGIVLFFLPLKARESLADPVLTLIGWVIIIAVWGGVCVVRRYGFFALFLDVPRTMWTPFNMGLSPLLRVYAALLPLLVETPVLLLLAPFAVLFARRGARDDNRRIWLAVALLHFVVVVLRQALGAAPGNGINYLLEKLGSDGRVQRAGFTIFDWHRTMTAASLMLLAPFVVHMMRAASRRMRIGRSVAIAFFALTVMVHLGLTWRGVPAFRRETSQQDATLAAFMKDGRELSLPERRRTMILGNPHEPAAPNARILGVLTSRPSEIVFDAVNVSYSSGNFLRHTAARPNLPNLWHVPAPGEYSVFEIVKRGRLDAALRDNQVGIIVRNPFEGDRFVPAAEFPLVGTLGPYEIYVSRDSAEISAWRGLLEKHARSLPGAGQPLSDAGDPASPAAQPAADNASAP